MSATVMTERAATRIAVRPSLPSLLLITLIFYIGSIILVTRHYHFNLSSLLMVGERSVPAVRAQLLGHHVVVFQHSEGFDGQLYYYVADDPLPMVHPTPFTNTLYYQRIVYPFLTAIVSLGHRGVRPLVMVSLNIASVIACAWLSWLLAIEFDKADEWRRGTSRSFSPSWWIVLAVINPSLILAVQLDLPEPLSYALALGGLLAWKRGRVILCAICFALALLTREITAVIVLPVLVVTLLHHRWRDALWIAATALPYAAWKVALDRTFTQAAPGVQSGAHALGVPSAENLGVPFSGMRQAFLVGIHMLKQHQIRSFLVHQASVLVIIVIVLGAGILALWQLRRGDTPVIGGSLLTSAGIGVIGTTGVWDAFTNAGRDFGLVFPLLVFSLATGRSHRSLALGLCLLSAVLTVLTVYRNIAVSPVLPYTLSP